MIITIIALQISAILANMVFLHIDYDSIRCLFNVNTRRYLFKMRQKEFVITTVRLPSRWIFTYFLGLKFHNPSVILIGEHNNYMPRTKMRKGLKVFTSL